jgi:hypothetical protein
VRVLVACEFSGIVRDAFAARGHDAWSCDLLPTERPGNHIQGDVLEVINEGWDLMIAHPPCTYLTVTGNSWFNVEKYGQRAIDRIFDRHKALEFVLRLYHAPIEKIAIENPVGYLSSAFRKPDQIIQPYYFGDTFQKTTCLWLKGLLPLTHTPTTPLFAGDWVDKGEMVTFASGKVMSKWYAESRGDWAERSKTFPGIANAMADQWGRDHPDGELYFDTGAAVDEMEEGL